MKFTRAERRFHAKGDPAKRPPKLKGLVANDLWPNWRRAYPGWAAAAEGHPRAFRPRSVDE